MINPVAAIKSDSNQAEMMSDAELLGALSAQIESLINEVETNTKRLDHFDEILHLIDQRSTEILAFIDEHKPALARGMALMDPGAKLRTMMGKGKRG